MNIFFSLLKFIFSLEKKSLLSAHFAITSLSKSKTVNIGHVRAYLTSLFGAEKKTLEKEKETVEKYQKETETLKASLQKLKNWYLCHKFYIKFKILKYNLFLVLLSSKVHVAVRVIPN